MSPALNIRLLLPPLALGHLVGGLVGGRSEQEFEGSDRVSLKAACYGCDEPVVGLADAEAAARTRAALNHRLPGKTSGTHR